MIRPTYAAHPPSTGLTPFLHLTQVPAGLSG